jgi:hypothetical protein
MTRPHSITPSAAEGRFSLIEIARPQSCPGRIGQLVHICRLDCFRQPVYSSCSYENQ